MTVIAANAFPPVVTWPASLRARAISANESPFHSIRGQFITDLARAGVNPKMAQKLARHSSMDLTMNFYTHLDHGEMADAVNLIQRGGEIYWRKNWPTEAAIVGQLASSNVIDVPSDSCDPETKNPCEARV